MVATPVTLDTIPSIDPATGQVTANFERTPPRAVPQLMAKARAAQATWWRRSIEERCAMIGVLQKKILEARDTLADVVVRESGKPRVEALFADVFVSLDTAEHFAKRGTDELRSESVRHHSTAAKAKSGRVYYEPLGVLGIISSWNYPLAIPFSQIIAAVAAGQRGAVQDQRLHAGVRRPDRKTIPRRGLSRRPGHHAARRRRSRPGAD